MPADEELEPYLSHLRQLPFIRDARVISYEPKGADAVVSLRTPAGNKILRAAVKRTHLTAELGERLVHLAKSSADLIVFAPLIGRDLSQRFEGAKVNFVDLVGNCHVEIDDRYYAHIEGRRGEQPSIQARALRAPSYQVLFALLAKSELVSASARLIAAAAGDVSPQTVIDVRKRLINSRALVSTQSLRWSPGGWKAALDLFVGGFATTLGPSLTIGRYRAREPGAIDEDASLITRLTAATSWRWGGGAACQRLTGYYRGSSTIIYVTTEPKLYQHRLIADAEGAIVLAKWPGPVAFESPKPDTVHPLLVYADLLAEQNDRATEAAGEVYERYLRKQADAASS